MPEWIGSWSIVAYSEARATEEATVLWALASAQYPLDHRIIQDKATVLMVEAVSNFSLNARRALEVIRERVPIALGQPRWKWEPATGGEVVGDLWEALNRIIHAKKLEVGWETAPASMSVIQSGAIVIPYVRAETDRRALSFIDPFALAHAFLYRALPLLRSQGDTTAPTRPN